MRAAMALATYPLYCRVCGHPWEAFRGCLQDQAIAMEWWELNSLVRGLGCPECEGQTPDYIRSMLPEDRAHVDRGFTTQWCEAVSKACKGSKPYEEFPAPAEPPFFIWAEPTMHGRFAALGGGVEELIGSIHGGADSLRVHPESGDSEFDNYRFGLWHVIPSEMVDYAAETSSVRYMNGALLSDVFRGKSETVGTHLWVLVGLDRAGELQVDEETISRLAVVEAAMRTYTAITPAIYQIVTADKK